MPLGYQQLLRRLFDVPWNLKRGKSTHPLVLQKPLHVIGLIVYSLYCSFVVHHLASYKQNMASHLMKPQSLQDNCAHFV